jgi:hypothetical protein
MAVGTPRGVLRALDQLDLETLREKRRDEAFDFLSSLTLDNSLELSPPAPVVRPVGSVKHAYRILSDVSHPRRRPNSTGERTTLTTSAQGPTTPVNKVLATEEERKQASDDDEEDSIRLGAQGGAHVVPFTAKGRRKMRRKNRKEAQNFLQGLSTQACREAEQAHLSRP